MPALTVTAAEAGGGVSINTFICVALVVLVVFSSVIRAARRSRRPGPTNLRRQQIEVDRQRVQIQQRQAQAQQAADLFRPPDVATLQRKVIEERRPRR
jgi:hypothetical protein